MYVNKQTKQEVNAFETCQTQAWVYRTVFYSFQKFVYVCVCVRAPLFCPFANIIGNHTTTFIPSI